MKLRVTTEDGASFAFKCEGEIEAYRVRTIFTKEPGTVRWLRNIRAGEVVYDIGANIGIYTVLAARQVGESGGRVYAFEPHVGNARSLLRNVAENQATDRVKVLTCALDECAGFAPFNYASCEPGSSGSQLGHVIAESGTAFRPAAVELKYGIAIDELIDAGIILPAGVVKLDVDGNELRILRGMSKLLTGGTVRSLQVEVHPKDTHALEEFLGEHGYIFVERHDTDRGASLVAKGADPEQVIHNAIFERAERAA